ncbi:hypothetical protein OG21DRAFT_1522519 [Imleria badia]|nr:hypothetical protein OG21DRAFT_1522519 [Imleria badia]
MNSWIKWEMVPDGGNRNGYGTDAMGEWNNGGKTEWKMCKEEADQRSGWPKRREVTVYMNASEMTEKETINENWITMNREMILKDGGLGRVGNPHPHGARVVNATDKNKIQGIRIFWNVDVRGVPRNRTRWGRGMIGPEQFPGLTAMFRDGAATLGRCEDVGSWTRVVTGADDDGVRLCGEEEATLVNGNGMERVPDGGLVDSGESGDKGQTPVDLSDVIIQRCGKTLVVVFRVQFEHIRINVEDIIFVQQIWVRSDRMECGYIGGSSRAIGISSNGHRLDKGQEGEAISTSVVLALLASTEFRSTPVLTSVRESAKEEVIAFGFGKTSVG